MSENEKEFCRIPSRLIEKYSDKIPFDLYLKLGSGKVIKIVHHEDSIIDIYNKYKAKGVANIYAEKESFEEFVSLISEDLESGFFDESTIEHQVTTLDDSLSMVREYIQKFGVTDKNIQVARQVAKKSLKLIESQSNIFKLFKDFKEKCSERYMHNITLSYTINALLDSVEWTSDSIREKSVLAVMLRDIMLSPEQVEEIKNWDGNPNSLSEETRKHPINTAEMLKESGGALKLSSEVITIIQVHHELPDGTGFPRGLKHNQIPQLAAMHIVADHFVTELMKNNFNHQYKNSILEHIKSKINVGTFKKTVDTLLKVVN